MRKRILLIALAGLMTLAACNKNKENQGVAQFTATIEHQGGRTSLDPNNGQINWVAGDQIVIGNDDGETAVFTLQSGEGTTEGGFGTSDEFNTVGPFIAAYPSDAEIENDKVTFNLPATQTIGETGTFGNGANPMVAYSDVRNLQFKNLCGGLGIRLKGVGAHVSAVRITSKNTAEKLWGAYEVSNCAANEPTLAVASGNQGTNVVTLNCDVTLTTAAKTFFVMLPPGTLAYGFTMEVLDGTEVLATKETTSDIALVERNKVKCFNEILIDVEFDGHVTIPTGMSGSDIIVTNYIEDAIPDENGDFAVGYSKMLVAKNADNGELLYFSINSIDRSIRSSTENDYELNAKETAIFIAMRLLPTSMMDAPDHALRNMKALLYDLPCVKNLETAIQSVVANNGYLDEEQIRPAVNGVKDFIYENFMSVMRKESKPNKVSNNLEQENLNAPYFSPTKKHGVRVVIKNSSYNDNDNDFYDSWKVNCDVQNSLMTMWGFVENSLGDGINYIDEDNLKYLFPTGLTNFVDQLISFDGLMQIVSDACNILSDPDYSPEFGKFIVKNTELEFPSYKNALSFVTADVSDKVMIAYIVYHCLYFADMILEACFDALTTEGAHIVIPIGIEDMFMGCMADGELYSLILREKNNGDEGFLTIVNAIAEKLISLIEESVQLDDWASTMIHDALVDLTKFENVLKGFDVIVGLAFNGLANDFSLPFVAEYENQYYPRLLTYEVENIGTNTAQFRGQVFPAQGGPTIIKRGFIYGTEPITADLNGTIALCQTNNDELQLDITGLNAFTYYYVRSYVQLSDGTSFISSNEVGFKTLSAVPILTTYPVEETDVTTTTAVLRGKVEGVASSSILIRGFYYNTSPQVHCNQPGVMSVDAEGGGTGEFTATATGLTPGQTYYYVAYIGTDQVEIFHGPEEHFTTLSSSQTFTITATANPTNGGTVTGSGTYNQDQSCTVTATANSGYTFSNWTENGNPVSTEASYTFTVSSNRTLLANFTANGGGGGDDHAYVDLGLPSGLLWATCNVGANAPEEYGDYFAWGETQPKDNYNLNTYQHCNGSDYTLTKYCQNSSYGYNGYTDELTTLLPEDDAATANWGNGWRMPTQAEMQELLDNTTVTWTQQNGKRGRLFTASNGNSLFLPAAGYRYGSSLYVAGSIGNYWTSSLYASYPYDAWRLGFFSGNIGMDSDGSRFNGRSVRPVRSSGQK